MEEVLFTNGSMVVLIFLYMLINFFYIRKQLGRLEYRVFTVFKSFGMFMFVSLLALRIGQYTYGVYTYFKRGSTIMLSIRGGIYPIPVILLAIYLIYRDEEIREKGIYDGFSILKWQDIKCFTMKTEKIIAVTTNKKSLFSKENKKIEWEVNDKEKMHRVKDVLNKYIQENDDILA